MFAFGLVGRTIGNPRVGVLNLKGADVDSVLTGDIEFLERHFPDVRRCDRTDGRCDLLFVYADIAEDGTLGVDRLALRSLIKESGAKILVVATPNPSEAYIRAAQVGPPVRANFVLTLDRKGEAFRRFLDAVFSSMRRGVPMPVAWAEARSNERGRDAPDEPDTIFACELGSVRFRKP